MVGVAQLVERQTVDLDVAGSNPVTHPMISITCQPFLSKVDGEHLFKVRNEDCLRVDRIAAQISD